MHPFGFRQAGRIGGSEDEWMCYRPDVSTMSVFIKNGEMSIAQNMVASVVKVTQNFNYIALFVYFCMRKW